MNTRSIFLLTFALCATMLVAAEPTHKLASVDKLPDGLATPIAAKLNPKGHRVMGPKGTVCDVWLAKSLEVKPGFKPSLSIVYPFTPGQLIGALRIAEKAKFTDFRGTTVKPGVYTLRYGQQPEDGNHLGTSETLDFLLALPAKIDDDPNLIKGFENLSQKSAKTGSTTHPAIFCLLPANKKASSKGSLSHDDDHDFWIVNVVAVGKEKTKDVPVPIRLVAIGRAEE